MSLKVWLPLNGDLKNLGCSGYEVRSANITVADDGKIGKCYSFNGSSSYINITNFEIGNNWSYGCWVNTPNSDSRTWEIVMILNNSGSDADSQFAFWIHQKENRFESLANTQYVSTIPYTNYYNEWHHFFATFNGSLLTSYIDGNVVNTKSITATQYNATNLTIGARSTNIAGTSFTNWFQGKLNDVRIYDHCLSALEIKEISQGLVLHYKLDGFNGGAGENILTNSTGNLGNTANWSGLITRGIENNESYLIARRTDTTSSSRTFCTHSTITSLVNTWKPGDKFTISGYYKIPSSENYEVTGNMFIRWTYTTSANNYADTGFSTSLTDTKDTWIRFEKTYTVPNNYVDGAVNFYLSAFSKGLSTIYWKKVKLEKNSIATSWTPTLSEMGIDTTKIIDSSGYGNDGFLINGTNEAIGINNGRYQVCTSLLGTTVDTTSNTITGAQYLYAPFEMPAWNAITVAWWGNNIAYGRGGIFETTGTTGNIWEGSDYNTTAIANWDSTFGIFNGTTRINIFNNFIKDSTWRHHAITFDGANVKYYCDSVLKQTSALTGTLPAITGFKMGLGKAGGVYRQIKQKLNDLRIYTTALSAEDIATLYHTPAQIDNLGNVHGFEVNEINIPYSINQIGQINMGNFFENGYQKYLKYDNNIYIEPDGSQWIRVFHHNDPTTSGYFVRNSDWEHGVYIDENKWYNIEEIVYTLPKYEFMVKQKTTSSTAETKYRWIQDINPLEATYNDVKPGTVIFNTSSGYTNSSYGGLWKMNSSARMCIANASSGNWFGALGSWSVYNTNQVPGFPNTTISTGYIDLYMRIYPPAKIVKDLGMSGNNFIEK